MMLQEILDKYDILKREGLLNEIVREIEGVISNNLPDDYKNFVQTYGEVELEINEQILLLFDVQALKEVNADYEVFEFCPEILVIGSNASGEGIAIDFKEQSPKIVLVPLIGMEREDFIEIGSSFTDMFERLESGRKWFD